MSNEFDDSTQPAVFDGLDQTRSTIISTLLSKVDNLNVRRTERKAVVDAHGEERVFRELQLRAVQQIAHHILQRASIVKDRSPQEAVTVQIEVCVLTPPELRMLLVEAYEEGRKHSKD